MNTLKRKFAVLAAAAVLGLTGCASNGEKGTVGAYFDDAAVTARVKKAIFNEPSLKVSDISVATDDATVHLTGSVKTRAERLKAAEVARRVDGVKRVKNDLGLKQ